MCIFNRGSNRGWADIQAKTLLLFHQKLVIHDVSKIRGAFFFDNLSRDEKGGDKVEKRPLVAELKLKMSLDA